MFGLVGEISETAVGPAMSCGNKSLVCGKIDEVARGGRFPAMNAINQDS